MADWIIAPLAFLVGIVAGVWLRPRRRCPACAAREKTERLFRDGLRELGIDPDEGV